MASADGNADIGDLAARLKQGMNAWSDFDAKEEVENVGKKGKQGRKKVKVAVAKAAVARGSAPSAKAPASRDQYQCRVEVSANGRGGKTGSVLRTNMFSRQPYT